MTDKTVREKIAEGNPYPKDEDTAFLTEVGLHDAYMAGVDATLADNEIKEGQELLEKARRGHNRSKSTDKRYYEPRGPVEHPVVWYDCRCGQTYCTTCYEGCWRCGKLPLASGESR